jgi:hypothetical protein
MMAEPEKITALREGFWRLWNSSYFNELYNISVTIMENLSIAHIEIV